ncbi:MAG: hypothetical protein QOJ89_4905 [bacterium]|jgi:hypothetical protein
MTAPRRILAAALPAAATLALAATAHAATVTTLPCVPVATGVKNMPVSVTGFTPGSLVTVQYAPKGTATPTYLTSGTVDPAGTFTTIVFPPSFNPFSRQLQTFGLLASDNINPAVTASTLYQQVRVGYTTNPSTGRPTRSAVHTVRGFPVGVNVYLHFRFQGKTKRNIKVGKTKAPCGIASKRMRLLPTRSHPGTWTVYVDQSAQFHKTTRPQLKYSFVISRTFG